VLKLNYVKVIWVYNNGIKTKGVRMNPHTGEIKKLSDLTEVEKAFFNPIKNKFANKEAQTALVGKSSAFPNFNKNPYLKKERKRMLKEEMAVAIKKAADSSKEAKNEVIALTKAGYGVRAMYEKMVKHGLFINKKETYDS